MAYFLFVDESGQDQQESPCEVLAGVALRDKTLWPFIKKIHEAENDCFGVRYSEGSREIKGKKLLKTKVFKLAESIEKFPDVQRRELAQKALQNGAGASPREYVALAQSKIEFARRLLSLCKEFKCVLFACLVSRKAPRPESRDFLRKDYAYLFERFFYFLNERPDSRGAGAIVFDELEKSRSHVLIGQMDGYFKRTQKGRERSKLVIPEPFFVHSDLSTGIQIADIAAYLLSWGYYKAAGDKSPMRPELIEFAVAVKELAYKSSSGQSSGITIIKDLRSVLEKGK
jgi:hypothetical protein